MRRRTFEAGEIVFHEGDPADSVHFVVEGRVVPRRSSVSATGWPTPSGPGQAFGELGMLARGRRRSATVQAIAPTVTLSLLRRLRAAVCPHPAVDRLLVRLLAARVRRLTEGLMEALHTPAELRVMRSLVSLCGLYSPSARSHAHR